MPRQDNVGLISTVYNDAVIKNIVFDNANIHGNENVSVVFGSIYKFCRGSENHVILENITLKNSEIRGDRYVGGIAGSFGLANSPSIASHINVDNVKVYAISAGGIAGYLNNADISHITVSNSYIGATTGTADGISAKTVVKADIYNVNIYSTAISGTTTGGLVGTWNTYGNSKESTVSHSKIDIKLIGSSDVGGAIGQLRKDIVNISNVSAKSEITLPYDDIFPASAVGGLVGDLNSSSLITENYVDTTIINQGPKLHNIGGLIGELSAAEVTNNFAQGEIIDELDVVEHNYVGGLFGSIRNNSTISNTYSKVKLNLSPRHTTSIGAFVGDNLGGYVYDSFWNPTDANFPTSPAGGTEATQAEMQTQSFYEAHGWCFIDTVDCRDEDQVWKMDGDDYPYPVLVNTLSK